MWRLLPAVAHRCHWLVCMDDWLCCVGCLPVGTTRVWCGRLLFACRYYTGVVWEAFDRRGELRAIMGGGRYGSTVICC